MHIRKIDRFLALTAMALLTALGCAQADDTTYVRFNTNLGSIDVQMLSDPTEAPNTVANFLNYVDTGTYRNSIIHRSVADFIWQGGGYDIQNGSLTALPANAAVANEFHVSNTRGTLALAKLSGLPDSGTNQWFFNEVDNSSNLDNSNGGFTVFGRVANASSLAVMDVIGAVPVPNPGPFQSPFDQIPLVDYNATTGPQIRNILFVNSIVRESLPAAATVTLSDLTATSTGAAQSVTATTNPPGLATVITFNNDPYPPSAVGSYTVNATITSPGYAGFATGTFVINAATTKTKATIKLSNLTATYDGLGHVPTAVTTPPGLHVTFTYDGTSTIPTEGGSHAVVATINDAVYSGTVKGTLTIAKIPVTSITLSNLTQTYTGAGLLPKATTVPPNLFVNYTFNGKAIAPTAAGSYKVVATLNEADYSGSVSGTMVIGKAAATVTLGSLAQVYTGKPLAATATTTPSGLNVTFTYNGKTTAPTTVGIYSVVGTIADPNHTGSGSGTLVISQGTAIVKLGNLAALFNGKAHAVTATTVPTNLKVNFTYDGSATVPSAIGSYNVVATVSDANNLGSTTGTLVISTLAASKPVTGAATGVLATQAVLNGTVNPGGSTTGYHFEYGTDQNYSLSTNNSSSDTTVGAGTANVPVTFTAVGLASNTLYHYRIVSDSAAGTVSGADKTFTTLREPIFAPTPFSYVSATETEAGQSVIPNGIASTAHYEYGTDTNYGMKTPDQSIGNGTTVVNFYALFEGLDPNTLYHYRLVIVSAAGTFHGADETFTTLGFTTTSVAQKSDSMTIAGNTASFLTFGNPAIDTNDRTAFTATLSGSGITRTNNAGIWADDSTSTRQLIAQTGTTAPDAGATFATLGDPVYNNTEKVAFRGTVTGASTTAAGLWTNLSGSLHLLARQGSPAPGATAGTPLPGATFASFNSLGITDSAGVVFLATLNPNTTTGIGTTNNVGIWQGQTSGDLHLILRLGDQINGTGPTIAKLVFLPDEGIVTGQTHSFAAGTGNLVCSVVFSDKTSAIVSIIGGVAKLQAKTGGPVDGIISSAPPTYSTFGTATINNNNYLAFEAQLTPNVGGADATGNTGIWADDSAGNRDFYVASDDATAVGTTATYVSFSNPVYNNKEIVAYLGTLKVAPGQATTSNATGIWSGDLGVTKLVARQGSQAPGCPTNASFAKFEALALPDEGGVVFLATLNINTTTGVSTSNDLGIWAVDTSGTLQLIVRTGDSLNVNGTPKVITSLAFLPDLAFVNGQTRSFDQGMGDLTYLATFSDKSTGIFKVRFP